jgi:ribosome maturation factor RimP
MKNIIIGLALLLLSVPFTVSAITTTPSPTPMAVPTGAPTSAVTKDVQDLKDKLATKVAELRKQNQKAVSGIIQEINTKTITIKDADDKSVQVKLDDVLTRAFDINGVVKKEIKVDTLKKGDYIIIAGPATDNTVTANAIYRDQQYLVGSGKITEVNKTDFTLRVATEDKENLTIDVDNKSRRFLVDSRTLAKEVIGFTKIKEGDTVHYVLTKTGQEKVKDRYPALRIVIIPQEYFIAK